MENYHTVIFSILITSNPDFISSKKRSFLASNYVEATSEMLSDCKMDSTKIGAVSAMLIRTNFVAGVARIPGDSIVRLWFEYGKKRIWKSFGNWMQPQEMHSSNTYAVYVCMIPLSHIRYTIMELFLQLWILFMN